MKQETIDTLTALVGSDLATAVEDAIGANPETNPHALPYDYWRVVLEDADALGDDWDGTVRGDQRDQRTAMNAGGLDALAEDPIGYARRNAFEAMRRQGLTPLDWPTWDARAAFVIRTDGPPADPTPAGGAD